MNQPDTFVAHDGRTYQGQPPDGWRQAQDGRWYPPESHPDLNQMPPPAIADLPNGTRNGPPADVDERPWWRKKRFLIPIGVFILLGIAGSFVDDGEDGAEETEQEEVASPTTTARSAAASSTTVVYRDFAEVDPFTDEYFIALESTTLAQDQGEERLWGLGRGVCQNLDRGGTIETETAGLVDDALLEPSDASALVAAAVTWVCPHNA